MAINLDEIQKRIYDVYYDGDDLGGTTALSISLTGVYNRADQVQQRRGVLKLAGEAIVPSITMTLQANSLDYVTGKLLADQMYREVQTSGNIKSGFYSGKTKILTGKELVLHPTGVDRSDRSNDLYFRYAVPEINATLNTDRDSFQTLDVTFTIIEDTDADPEFALGVWGDWGSSTATPRGVVITTDDKPLNPTKHVSALTLPAGSVAKVQALACYSSDSTTTAALNDASDINSTDTSIAFDGLNVANGIQVGDYIEMGTEVIYVSAITYATSTTGTITGVRGALGTTADSHVDDAVITLQKNVYRILVTDAATWASSDATKATAGNSYPGTTQASKKGVITHVAAGSTNVTAAFGGATSPTLAVTAS